MKIFCSRTRMSGYPRIDSRPPKTKAPMKKTAAFADPGASRMSAKSDSNYNSRRRLNCSSQYENMELGLMNIFSASKKNCTTLL